MIDLADTLKSIDDFLNTHPDDIIQVKNGSLTKEQLKEGKNIVRKNPEIMKFYEYFDKYRDGCNECIYRINCCEIFGVVDAGDLYYCHDYLDHPMFVPERIFEKVRGFENLPKQHRLGYFDED